MKFSFLDRLFIVVFDILDFVKPVEGKGLVQGRSYAIALIISIFFFIDLNFFLGAVINKQYQKYVLIGSLIIFAVYYRLSYERILTERYRSGSLNHMAYAFLLLSIATGILSFIV